MCTFSSDLTPNKIKKVQRKSSVWWVREKEERLEITFPQPASYAQSVVAVFSLSILCFWKRFFIVGARFAAKASAMAKLATEDEIRIGNKNQKMGAFWIVII